MRPAGQGRFCGGIGAMLVKYSSLSKLLNLFESTDVATDCIFTTAKTNSYCVNWGLIKNTIDYPG